MINPVGKPDFFIEGMRQNLLPALYQLIAQIL